MNARFFFASPLLASILAVLPACGGAAASQPGGDSGTNPGEGSSGDSSSGPIVGEGGQAPVTDAGVWIDASAPSSIEVGELARVTATGPSDVWAVGDGVILHYDGTTWSGFVTDSATYFSGIWANTTSDAWVVGAIPGPQTFAGSIEHWDGTAWSVLSGVPATNNLYDVWGSGSDDVWAVGDVAVGSGLDAVVLHYDGKSWSTAYEDRIQDFGSVWGSGPTDVWVAGVGGVVHFDGKSWASRSPTPGGLFSGLWGSGPDDVWVAGTDDGEGNGTLFHWNGTAWSAGTFIGSESTVGSLWGSGPNDIWAVGVQPSGQFSKALTLHWDGDTWAPVTVSSGTATLSGVGGSARSNVWCVGDNVILRLD